jgi:hypothetical protein
MKLLRLLFLIGLIPLVSIAQDVPTETIVDRINKPEPGKGSVLIIQDESITERLGRAENNVSTENISQKFVELSGYRIQVFSGNNQRISKNEAYTKEANVKSVFSELSTYVGFTAPFWRLRVGDFQTFQEAQRVLVRLRAEFPAYGREMSIVKEKIKVKVQ